MSINWYPGHMAKTKRIIKEKLDLIDIVYEVIDARIPFSSKINDIDEYIKKKPRILIMTKIDLCDMSETNKWIKYYQDKGYNVIGLNLDKNTYPDELVTLTKEVLQPLNDKRKSKGLQNRSYRALVMGIPNVGKSTLINRLAGKKATTVGDRPGVTKSLDWVRINKDIELLDSPGVLWPRLDNKDVAFNLASMGTIREEVIPLDEVSIYILKTIFTYYPDSLIKRYNVNNIDFDNIVDTLDLIGKKRGCIIRGGEVDYKKVYTLIMRDLNDGHLGPVTFDRYNNER